MEQGPLIRVEGLAGRFGEAGPPVFENLWFGVDRGEFVCLIGHSGCGKTTILNVLAGLGPPDEGAVVRGKPAKHGPTLPRRRMFPVPARRALVTPMGSTA